MSESTMPPVPRPMPYLAWAQTPLGKAGLLLLLLLLLQWPLIMVSDLIAERQRRQADVSGEMGQSWGPEQTVAGPVLAVPVVRTYIITGAGAMRRTERGWATVPPAALSVSAQLQPEDRRRGLFHAVVYTAGVDLAGSFKLPAAPQSGDTAIETDMRWPEAVLLFGATDLRGQPAAASAGMGGQPAAQSVGEVGGTCGGTVTIPAGLSGAPDAGAGLAFRTRLLLRGTRAFAVEPAGRQVSVRVAAPWATPGFTGANLPLQHSEDARGFTADWQVVGGSPASAWKLDWSGQPPCLLAGRGNPVSVELLDAVPTYLMVVRASKYGTLFLVLAFMTYFLFEVAGRVRIHVAQYALLGLSVALFALLLVALAEPLGFVPGYTGATAAVMAQASLYTWSVVGSWRLAAVFAAVLGALFGFLYVVISLDSYALLVGTVAVFAALSMLMAATWRMDWGGGVRQASRT